MAQQDGLTGWQAQLAWAASRMRVVVRREGVGSCFRRLGGRLARVLRGQASLSPYGATDRRNQYRTWRRRRETESGGYEARRADLARSASHPLFVFAMPVRDTQVESVARTIESFRRQVYPHWELYLCGSPELPGRLRGVLETAARQDTRVTYVEVSEDRLGWERVCAILSDCAGDFVGLLEDLIELEPDALLSIAERHRVEPDAELFYGDHDRIAADGEPADPFFKPPWNPDLLLSMNYLGPLCLFRRDRLRNTDAWERIASANGLYGLLLKFTDCPRRVVLVPNVLCHVLQGRDLRRRTDPVGAGEDSIRPAALSEALCRRHERGHVTDLGGGRMRVVFQPTGAPLVSIIIPSRDQREFLHRCIESIERQTHHVRYEIVVVDNGTREVEARRYLERVAARHRVIPSPGEFNFSALNNEGVRQSAGDYLLFMNNDTEVVSPDWLFSMLGQVQRSGVGAVGAKLLYSDGRIQHAGVVLGVCGVAGHAFRYVGSEQDDPHHLSDSMRNCSAVTAACMMVPRSVFTSAGGFDEGLPVEFNDVDLCLRIRGLGLRIVYAPEVVLYHHENATRGARRAPKDEKRFVRRWQAALEAGDPYYNPNLTRRREDWSLDC